MSVPLSILTLLSREPAYGYQLKTEFEARTGGAYPMNIGQIYTTLSRLERDGLVAGLGADAEGRVMYAITDTGRAEVERWFGEAVPRGRAPRDELTIKLALADVISPSELSELIAMQRKATMDFLGSLTATKQAYRSSLPRWLLVVDRLIYDSEAELRWLDHVEATLKPP